MSPASPVILFKMAGIINVLETPFLGVSPNDQKYFTKTNRLRYRKIKKQRHLANRGNQKKVLLIAQYVYGLLCKNKQIKLLLLQKID